MTDATCAWYALIVYVPEAQAAAVKAAAFAAGAGHLGNYAECSWQTAGTGQFRPLPGSQPFSGTRGAVAQEPEVKVEMLCPAACLGGVVAALKTAHPYETPVILYWAVNLA